MLALLSWVKSESPWAICSCASPGWYIHFLLHGELWYERATVDTLLGFEDPCELRTPHEASNIAIITASSGLQSLGNVRETSLFSLANLRVLLAWRSVPIVALLVSPHNREIDALMCGHVCVDGHCSPPRPRRDEISLALTGESSDLCGGTVKGWIFLMYGAWRKIQTPSCWSSTRIHKTQVVCPRMVSCAWRRTVLEALDVLSGTLRWTQRLRSAGRLHVFQQGKSADLVGYRVLESEKTSTQRVHLIANVLESPLCNHIPSSWGIWLPIQRLDEAHQWAMGNVEDVACIFWKLGPQLPLRRVTLQEGGCCISHCCRPGQQTHQGKHDLAGRSSQGRWGCVELSIQQIWVRQTL